jgi:lipopolysaccharide transport system permease protein
MRERNTAYYPDKSIKQGYLSLFREMIREANESRWLTWQLFKRSFIATYRQAVLGIFWALLVPFASVGTFIFLNRAGVFNVGEISVPYPLFAIAGVAFWQIFSVGLAVSANSLVSAGSMITKINFNRESLVISAVAQGIIPAIVQIALVFVLFGFYQIMPPLTALLVPLTLIPLLLLTLGLGFILSLFNGILRDIGNGINALITLLIFLTPVFYAKPSEGIAAAISAYNPLYYLISVPRDLLLIGSTADLEGYLYSSLFSLIVFFICWAAFHLTETRIAERI